MTDERTCENCKHENKDMQEWPCVNCKNNVRDHFEKDTGGWIPCSERPPEELTPVNVTWVNRKPAPYYENIKNIPFTATAVYCNKKWFWWSSICEDILAEYGRNDAEMVDEGVEILAWMPLPEPYEESEEK